MRLAGSRGHEEILLIPLAAVRAESINDEAV